jgi:hypothetical protein
MSEHLDSPLQAEIRSFLDAAHQETRLGRLFASVPDNPSARLDVDFGAEGAQFLADLVEYVHVETNALGNAVLALAAGLGRLTK